MGIFKSCKLLTKLVFVAIGTFLVCHKEIACNKIFFNVFLLYFLELVSFARILKVLIRFCQFLGSL